MNTDSRKVPRFCPFDLLVRAKCRWKWLLTSGRMILKGENRSRLNITCLSGTLCTINPKWTDIVSNPGMCGDRPATNLWRSNLFRQHITIQFLPHSKQCICVTRTKSLIRLFSESHESQKCTRIFRRIRKTIAKNDSLLRLVCPSVLMENLDSYWTCFHAIYFGNFWNKISLPSSSLVVLKSDTNDTPFPWIRPDIDVTGLCDGDNASSVRLERTPKKHLTIQSKLWGLIESVVQAVAKIQKNLIGRVSERKRQVCYALHTVRN